MCNLFYGVGVSVFVYGLLNIVSFMWADSSYTVLTLKLALPLSVCVCVFVLTLLLMKQINYSTQLQSWLWANSSSCFRLNTGFLWEKLKGIYCSNLLISYAYNWRNILHHLTSILSFPCVFSASSSDKPTHPYSSGVNTVVGTLKTQLAVRSQLAYLKPH